MSIDSTELLPQPTSPRMHTNSPLRTLNSMPFRVMTSASFYGWYSVRFFEEFLRCSASNLVRAGFLRLSFYLMGMIVSERLLLSLCLMLLSKSSWWFRVNVPSVTDDLSGPFGSTVFKLSDMLVNLPLSSISMVFSSSLPYRVTSALSSSLAHSSELSCSCAPQWYWPP